MGVLLRMKTEVPDISKRAIDRAAKDAFRDVGKRWDRQYKKMHFGPSAKSRYGYQTRSSKYTIRKFKQKSHRRPLVWSGTTEGIVRQRQFPRVYPRRVTITIQTPKYIRIRSQKGRPPMADEITRLAPAERDALEQTFAEVMDRGIQAELDNPRARRQLR